jgi:hypothetical protein
VGLKALIVRVCLFKDVIRSKSRKETVEAANAFNGETHLPTLPRLGSVSSFSNSIFPDAGNVNL